MKTLGIDLGTTKVAVVIVENRHLLVVDDVMTTGSTLSSILEIIEKTVPSVKLSVFTLALAQ